jgi:O-acetyl-ADP-ribose deacetylase (regulator of RNase III)
MGSKPSTKRARGKRETSFSVRGCRVTLIDASIAALDEHQGALVSPDNSLLTHSGGASRAVWSRAGEAELSDWVARTKPVLHLGDVLESPPFGAAADHILHAIVHDLESNRIVGPAELRGLYGRILTTAAGLACTRIALPALASGAAGLAAEATALAAADGLDEHLGLGGSVERVVFALPTDLDTFARIFSERFAARAMSPALRELFRRAAKHGRPELLQTWGAYAGDDGPSATVHLTLLLDQALRFVLDTANPAARVAGSRPPPKTFGEMLSSAADAAKIVGRPLPAEVVRKVSLAIDQRNRLVHQQSLVDVTPEVTGKMLAGIEVALSWALDAQDQPSFEFSPSAKRRPRAWATLPVSHLLDGMVGPSGDTPQAKAKGRTATPPSAHVTPAVPQGTAHVRKLHRFLLDHLDAEESVDLITQLRKEGYVGEDSLCLLEYCVREQPVKILTEHFATARLRNAAKEVVGAVQAQSSKEDIARILLRAWGFPREATPRGIRAVAAEVRRAKDDSRHQSVDELRGSVATIAGQLEYILHVVVRFLCRAVYNSPPEMVLSLERPLLKSSLGVLLEAVARLAVKLRDDGGGETALRLGMDPRPLLQQNTQEITALRNSFIHLRSTLERPALGSQRADAQSFFSAVSNLLNVVGRESSNLFPQIIRIEQIVIDRWGRRSVTATDEYGKTERIFTDEPVEAGQIYFMRSRTNPLCVDPILVPGGDLGSGDAGSGAGHP